MVEIERSPGQELRIGSYTLRVVAVHPDRVVFALRGPGEGGGRGGRTIIVPRENLAWISSAESAAVGGLPA
jgi:hypothetical protein